MKPSRVFALTAVVALSTALARADLPPSPDRNVAISPEAKQHFSTGVTLLQDPDGSRYEDAYREFRAAYEASPSWKILGNLGLCALKLERNGEAIEAYERYLAQGGKDIEAGERTQIEKDLAVLKATSVAVSLSSDLTADASVLDTRTRSDGRLVVNTYPLPAGKTAKLWVQSGRHAFVARSGDKESRWETELSANKPQDHKFSLVSKAAAPPASTSTPPPPATTGTSTVAPPPPSTTTPSEPPRTSTLRTAGYVTAGVGGALLIGGVVTGLIGRGKLSDLDSKCPNKTCASQGDIDSVESMQTLTNVLWISGAVLAAGGVTMIVLGKTPESSASAAVRVVPSVTPGGGGLFAVGRF